MTTTTPAKTFDLEKEMVALLGEEPFYAAISRFVTKRPNKNIKTACVFVDKNGHFHMEYNPEFMGSLSPRHRLGVIKHELQHIILGHVTNRCPSKKSDDRKYWNIATDLAINSLLGTDELPEFCLMPGRGPYAHLEHHMASEGYLAAVRGLGDDQSEGSDHSRWTADDTGDEGSASANDIAENRCKDMIKKAMKECSQMNSWGTVTGDLKKEILERLKVKIDWRKVLGFFVKTSMKSAKRNTIKIINRRYPYIHAGRKTLRHAKIAISIDMSGSVGNDLLAVFFSELDKLAQIAEFTVIPFDTEPDLDAMFVWKKGTHKFPMRTKCGGTDFTPVSRYVNENDFDGHIVMTDMGAGTPCPSRVPRLWVTTEAMIKNGYGHKPVRERVVFVEMP